MIHLQCLKKNDIILYFPETKIKQCLSQYLWDFIQYFILLAIWLKIVYIASYISGHLWHSQCHVITFEILFHGLFSFSIKQSFSCLSGNCPKLPPSLHRSSPSPCLTSHCLTLTTKFLPAILILSGILQHLGFEHKSHGMPDK